MLSLLFPGLDRLKESNEIIDTKCISIDLMTISQQHRSIELKLRLAAFLNFEHAIHFKMFTGIKGAGLENPELC